MIFDWRESYSTRLDKKPNVLTAKFGDGYSQRAGNGINTIPERWSMVFSKVDNSIADSINAFFATHAGVTSFQYNPPNHPTYLNFICPEWSRSYNAYGSSDLTAIFEQVF